MTIKNSLEVKSLSKTVKDAVGTINILSNLTFNVESGSSLAITGSSGSGKSTLLGLLAGLDVASSGEVVLLGHELSQQSEEQRAQIRAKHVGFVFQSFQLLPNLTALENVMLPLELANKEAKSNALEMLEKVGLINRINHYPKTLSGGEQQRVSIARAFVSNPDILFADEPTGSLDTEKGNKIIDLMFKLRADNNTTLVLVTHDENLAKLCDKQLKL